jgi:hypothetical protein
LLKKIFDDITFFLKSLPKIKDAKLLSSYDKAYKKLEKFMKSTTVNFEGTNILSVDNHNIDSKYDDNNVLLEKITDNNTIFYKIQYLGENKLISIFSEDGNSGYHYKIKSDGSKEELPLSSDDGFLIEFKGQKDYYEENKYKVIESITVNKDTFNSYFGENYDSYCKKRKPLNLNIINLLFENNVLMKIKNNKIFDVRVNISNLITGNENVTGTNRSNSKNQLQENNFETKNNYRPIFNNSFLAGSKILLAGGYGVGKNLLTIEVANLGIKKGLVKTPCFFNFEDKTNKLQQRYTDVFGKRCHIVDFTTWNNMLESSEAVINRDNIIIANNFKELDRMEIIKDRRNRNRGIYKKDNYRVECLIKLMENEINKGCDFFVLDSLGEIFENINNYHQDLFSKLLNTANDNMTFIIIHHLDKKLKDIQGNKRFKNRFDAVYYLYKRDDLPKSEKGDIFEIQVEKNELDPDDKSFYFERTKKSEFVAEYKILKNDNVQLHNKSKKNKTEQVKSYLLNSGKKILSRTEVENAFKNKIAKGTITNAFMDLQRENVIEMVDGKTYNEIKIISC